MNPTSRGEFRLAITYTPVRERAYAEAFPLFSNDYASSKGVRVPADGAKAYALRVELVEGTANLIMLDERRDNICIIDRAKAVTLASTLASIVEVVYEAGAKDIFSDMLPSNNYARARFEHDERRKLHRW